MLDNLQKYKSVPKVKIITLTKGTRDPENFVEFIPYDFQFDDNFKPEWNQYDAFGRMDPVMIYKKTTRDCSLSFNVVADSSTDAQKNFTALQKLISFLYPVYGELNFTTNTITNPTNNNTNNQIGQVILKSPLVVVQFMNLLNSQQYVAAVTSFKHKLEFDAGGTSLANKTAIPGKFNISIAFKVVHTNVKNFSLPDVYTISN